MSTNIVKLFFWNAAQKRDEMLEPCDGKLSCTVLRRESGSDPADLADTIFGGFAPNSKTAEELSKSLGSYTVQSGSVTKGKNDNSRTLQLMERPLMTPDELKSIPKGEFVVMKTGSHPMKTKLQLFLDWGITFGEPYQTPEHGQRKVYYAGREELEAAIENHYWIGPEQGQTAEQELEKQSCPSQKGQPATDENVDWNRERRAGPATVRTCNLAKKQDAPQSDLDGGDGDGLL